MSPNHPFYTGVKMWGVLDAACSLLGYQMRRLVCRLRGHRWLFTADMTTMPPRRCERCLKTEGAPFAATLASSAFVYTQTGVYVGPPVTRAVDVMDWPDEIPG